MTSKPAPPESARRALSGGAGLEVIGQPQRENETGVPHPENDHLFKKTQYTLLTGEGHMRNSLPPSLLSRLSAGMLMSGNLDYHTPLSTWAITLYTSQHQRGSFGRPGGPRSFRVRAVTPLWSSWVLLKPVVVTPHCLVPWEGRDFEVPARSKS